MHNPILENIFYAYEENFTEEPGYFISFYEENASCLNSVDYFDDECLFKYEAIAGRYLEALIQLNEYKKAVFEADIIVNKIESSFERLNSDPEADQWYFNIIYQRAIARYNCLLFRASNRDFRQLAYFDPDSDNIKAWLHATKYHYYEYFYLLVSMVFMVCYWFLRNLLHPAVSIVVLAASIICCIISFKHGFTMRRKIKELLG